MRVVGEERENTREVGRKNRRGVGRTNRSGESPD
jgi:hypothetical protein